MLFGPVFPEVLYFPASHRIFSTGGHWSTDFAPIRYYFIAQGSSKNFTDENEKSEISASTLLLLIFI